MPKVTDNRQELYDQGLNDMDIALALGTSKPAIFQWRKCRGLPPCATPSPRSTHFSIERQQERQAAYDEGLSDAEMAARTGVSPKSIKNWRVRTSRPNNYRKRIPKPPKLQRIRPMRQKPRTFQPSMRADPLMDMVMQAIARGLARDIRDDAVSEMVLSILSGETPFCDIAKSARRFTGRAISQYASSYNRSFDAPLPGTDNLRLVDLIADERCSDWLEEMGATVW